VDDTDVNACIACALLLFQLRELKIQNLLTTRVCTSLPLTFRVVRS
jgi:hypothetical protein